MGGTQTAWKEKIKNAYLLFYDRVTPYHEETAPKPDATQAKEESKETEIEKEEPNQDTKIIVEPPANSSKEQTLEFYKQIMEENKRFYRHRHMFSQEYFEFLTEFVMKHNYEPNADVLPYPFTYSREFDPKKYLDMEMLKLGVIFFLTSMVRERERRLLYRFLPFLKRVIEQVIKNLLKQNNFFSPEHSDLLLDHLQLLEQADHNGIPA